MNPAILEKLIGGRPSKFSDADRTGYAQEAAALLARIAVQPKGPFTADLAAAEPALAAALSQPGTSLAASTALGDVPNPDAQRSLADVVLDPSRSVELRRTSAARLAHSIQRFGPLVSADQETQLAAGSGAEADPQLRSALEAVVTALRAPAHAARRAPQSATPAGIAVPGTGTGTRRTRGSDSCTTESPTLNAAVRRDCPARSHPTRPGSGWI